MLAVLLLNRMTMKRRTARRQRTIKIENNNDEGKKAAVEEYCRTCLSTQDLVSLFFNKETEKKRSEDLKLVTGLEIKMDDELSQKICIKCVDSVNNALNFRRTSRKAEKTLLTMVQGTKQKKKEKKYATKTQKRVIKKRTEQIVNREVDMNIECKVDYQNDDFQNDDFQNDDFHNDDLNNDAGNDVPIDSFGNDEHVAEEAANGAAEGEALKPSKKKYLNIPNASSYKCATCNKEFRMKSTYKAHMRFHTNYCVCESCGKRCRNNNQLQEHKRARHGLGRIHKCAYCEYSSATKEALVIHERRHTGERPYVCDHCGATFHRRSNLVQHIAIHLPEKNFQCDMCPKRLKSRKFLQIHKHNAHTGKRYAYLCAVCDHRFEKPNKVRAHTRRVHGLPDDQQPPIARVQL